MSVTRHQSSSLFSFILLLLFFSCGNTSVNTPKSVSDDTLRKNTTIEWLTETTHDFGIYTEREVKQFDFVYHNIGDVSFLIDSVLTSCGCTHVEYNKKPVLPDKTDTIRVFYSGNGFLPGYFFQQCVLYGNVDKPVVLEIKGIFDHVE